MEVYTKCMVKYQLHEEFIAVVKANGIDKICFVYMKMAPMSTIAISADGQNKVTNILLI